MDITRQGSQSKTQRSKIANHMTHCPEMAFIIGVNKYEENGQTSQTTRCTILTLFYADAICFLFVG